MIGIYAIRNKLTNRSYIGSSKNIHKRWESHKYMLDKGTHHCDYLQRAWSKYGSKNFEFIVLEECHNEQLLQREQNYFDSSGYELYNSSKHAGKPPDPTFNQRRKLAVLAYIRWLKRTKFQDTFERCEQHAENLTVYQASLRSFDEFYNYIEDSAVDPFGSIEPILPLEADVEDDSLSDYEKEEYSIYLNLKFYD